MIFITTGSRSFQFNRLLKAVDEAIENGLITDSVFAQIGSSDYKIKNYEYVEFLDREKFNASLNSCDVVLTYGGSAGIFVKKFCENVSSIGISVDVSVMKVYDNKIMKLFGYICFYLSTFFRVLFGKYDIVYIHYASHSSIPILWAVRFKELNIYTNVHGSDVVPESTKQEKFQKYTKRILSISEKVIVPSDYFKDYVSEKYSLDSSKIYVYPSSGIDMSLFNVKDNNEIESLKEKYRINDNVTFCYVGRITWNKGWDIFLKAVSRIIKSGLKANFIVVGAGNEDNLFEILLNQLDLRDSIIRFPLLSQNELVNIYNISDAFVFPTKREGESLGLVAVEAMACGTPVIASDFAAPKYYVKNSINGYKFAVNDDVALSHIMEKFISGEYQKKELQDGCLETAAVYDSMYIMGSLKKIFEVSDSAKSETIG